MNYTITFDEKDLQDATKRPHILALLNVGEGSVAGNPNMPAPSPMPQTQAPWTPAPIPNSPAMPLAPTPPQVPQAPQMPPAPPAPTTPPAPPTMPNGQASPGGPKPAAANPDAPTAQECRALAMYQADKFGGEAIQGILLQAGVDSFSALDPQYYPWFYRNLNALG